MTTQAPSAQRQPEPWLRGTFTEVPAVQRAALHALELTREDLSRWCSGLQPHEVNDRPAGLPSIAFHLRHIARSLDRLLTYAESRELRQEQLSALAGEHDPSTGVDELLSELHSALDESAARIRRFDPSALEQPRSVGKKRLPATLAGLLVHVADHTQRHTGQAITTTKLLLARRSGA